MDADDISKENRLEKQLRYMEQNKDVDLIGSNITYINEYGQKKYDRNKIPETTKTLSSTMKLVNTMHHPTFFGKTEIFKKYKYRKLKYSQDYDLTCRMLEDGKKINNINESLLYYRQKTTKNDEKLLLQRITYYTIQDHYRKKNLSKTNIENMVKKRYNHINKDKEIKAIKKYDMAIESFKNNNKIKAFILLTQSILTSKYQLRQIVNTIKYKLIYN